MVVLPKGFWRFLAFFGSCVFLIGLIGLAVYSGIWCNRVHLVYIYQATIYYDLYACLVCDWAFPIAIAVFGILGIILPGSIFEFESFSSGLCCQVLAFFFIAAELVSGSMIVKWTDPLLYYTYANLGYHALSTSQQNAYNWFLGNMTVGKSTEDADIILKNFNYNIWIGGGQMHRIYYGCFVAGIIIVAVGWLFPKFVPSLSPADVAPTSPAKNSP